MGKLEWPSSLYRRNAIRIWGRLKKHFPILREEIMAIIEAFNQETYGNRIISKDQLSDLTKALKRLRSPKHWPSRLKNWLIIHDGKGEMVQKYQNF